MGVKASKTEEMIWQRHVESFKAGGLTRIKYENVYLYAYDAMKEAREHLNAYLESYNRERPHQSLDSKTPDEVYLGLAFAEFEAA